MGQAVADLPDPLESANPTDAKSADDLLSQLAGDEIDRLLAESEGEPAPAPKPAAIVETVAETSAPTAAAVPAAPSTAAPTAPVESVDLDAVLDTAVSEHQAAAAERSALHPPDKAPTVAKPKDHSPQIELGETRRVPLILRPLEWLSSPLDPWPDQIREVLGKIGLMTLINAVAVLAYVLIVRRHHH